MPDVKSTLKDVVSKTSKIVTPPTAEVEKIKKVTEAAKEASKTTPGGKA